jgi:hypothetical protein
MKRSMIRITLLIASLLLVAFTVGVVNQTAQVVTLAGTLAPWFGNIVLWILLAIYAACIGVPLYLIFRFPKPLTAPASEDDLTYPAHLELLKARLAANPHLGGTIAASKAEVEQALKKLDSVAEERTRAAASRVFISTAISQNGSLDILLVLSAQQKLILDIARIYSERPSLRDLLVLYANVAGTAFVAGGLDELDVSEQMEPVLGALMGSALGAIPGLGAATTVLTNSILSGTANAYLTLRVGIIAQQYSRSVVLPPRRNVRRSAMLKATGMLGSITLEGSKRIMISVKNAAKHRAGAAVGAAGDNVRLAGGAVRDGGTAAASATLQGARSVGASLSSAAGAAAASIRRIGSAEAEQLNSTCLPAENPQLEP